jgi:hypothetical protein
MVAATRKRGALSSALTQAAAGVKKRAARARRGTQQGSTIQQKLNRKRLRNLKNIREQCLPGKPCTSKFKKEYIAEIIEFLENSPNTNVTRRLAAEFGNSTGNTSTTSQGLQGPQGPREAGRAGGAQGQSGFKLAIGGAALGTTVTALIHTFSPIKIPIHLNIPSWTLDSSSLVPILNYAKTSFWTIYSSLTSPEREIMKMFFLGFSDITDVLLNENANPVKFVKIYKILKDMCHYCIRLLKIRSVTTKMGNTVRDATNFLADAVERLQRTPRRNYSNLTNNYANSLRFGPVPERTLMDIALDVYRDHQIVVCILAILSVLITAGYIHPPIGKWAKKKYQNALTATSSGLRWTGRKVRNTAVAAYGMRRHAVAAYREARSSGVIP